MVEGSRMSKLGALVVATALTAVIIVIGVWQANSLPAGDTVPPGKVRGLTVTSVGGGRLLLVWQDAEDNYGVSHYVIRRDGAALDDEPTFTHYLDEGLELGRPYRYTVMAVDVGGNEGPPSDAVTGTPEP